MPRGENITDTDIALMTGLREKGKSNKEIAKIFGVVEKTIDNHIGSDRPKIDTGNADYGALVTKISDIKEMTSRLVEKIDKLYVDQYSRYLSFKALGFRNKDERTYEKKDGNQTLSICYINNQQINYCIKDAYGKVIDKYYFNSQLIEAMYDAIAERKWNYFK